VGVEDPEGDGRRLIVAHDDEAANELANSVERRCDVGHRFFTAFTGGLPLLTLRIASWAITRRRNVSAVGGELIFGSVEFTAAPRPSQQRG
jgi:hypothetical protein